MAWRRKFQLNADVRKSRNAWTTDKDSLIHDGYGVLEKIAWIWRIAGIFPLTVKGPMGIVKYEVNKVYATYSSLICCACIGNYIYTIKVHNLDLDENEDVVTPNLMSLLCLFVASIMRIFCHKEMSGIINAMAGQDLILEKMNCSLRYESDARIIGAYVWASSISAALLLTYDYYTSRQDYDSVTIQSLLSIVPMMGQILDQTIFVSLVGLLGLKFRALNEKLIAVVTRANSSPPKIIVTSDFCAENLRKIAKAHYSICAVGKRINKFFAWEMIVSAIATFMTLNQSLFAIFVEVQQPGESNLPLIGMHIDRALIHTVPIIIIVATCNWTSRQSTDARKLIHQTRVDKIESRLYEAVKTFSLQLHHQKLEFNAFGFYPINSTLIQKNIAEITAYQVFLIQVKATVETM